jgi:hypothetical protein
MINKKIKGRNVEEAPRPYLHNFHNAFGKAAAQSVSANSLGKNSYIVGRKWNYALNDLPRKYVKVYSLIQHSCVLNKDSNQVVF